MQYSTVNDWLEYYPCLKFNLFGKKIHLEIENIKYPFKSLLKTDKLLFIFCILILIMLILFISYLISKLVRNNKQKLAKFIIISYAFLHLGVPIIYGIIRTIIQFVDYTHLYSNMFVVPQIYFRTYSIYAVIIMIIGYQYGEIKKKHEIQNKVSIDQISDY